MKPDKIKVHKQSRLLELAYAGRTYQLSYEYLRVLSPSAEVRGHGKGNEVLQTGKKDVGLKNIEPVGNYALKLVFDDGHDTGLYTWPYLHDLCINQSRYWQTYLDNLETAGHSRSANSINFKSL